MKRKKRSAHPETISNLPRRLREGLEQADRLLDQGQPVEAKEILEELNERYPHQEDVLALLANTYIDTNDHHGYLHAMLELRELRPNSPDISFGLAGAYLSSGYLALALQAFERCLARWPGHPAAEDARRASAEIQEHLEKELNELGLKEAGLAFARKHEEMQVHLETGRFQRAKQLARELLNIKPDFVPVLNNLSQVYWLENDLPKAIETCQQVLAVQPDNVHALANLIRFLYMAGRREETPAYVARLKTSQAPATERWTKIAEALSFIGDDQGMLDLRTRALKEGGLNELNEFFYHALAVSELMLGQEGAAKADWQRALKMRPDFELAQENLDDLNLPKHQRKGPWMYSLNQILPGKTIEELISVTERAAKSKSEAATQSKIKGFLNGHPEILQLAPLILERGEPMGKDFIIKIADISGHPELLSLLKEFAFGQRGSDDMRLEAAQVLSKHNVVPAGEVKMWIKGEWTPILLLGFEITPEPILDFSLKPEVQNLMESAVKALRKENGALAEQHLRKALAIQPEVPPLLNNLALALLMQNKEEEAEAILQHLIKDFPDYFFGQMAAARKAIQAGELVKARAILDHWMTAKKTYHISEFSILCRTQIDLMMQEKSLDGALSWLELWKSAVPDDPNLEMYTDLLEISSKGKSKQHRTWLPPEMI